jgi:hypothetical protein
MVNVTAIIARRSEPISTQQADHREVENLAPDGADLQRCPRRHRAGATGVAGEL